MKKFFFFIVFFVIAAGMVFSQSDNDMEWGGLARFRPLATAQSIIFRRFEIVADVVPYIAPNIGIPIEIDIFTNSGNVGIGIMSGIEALPFPKKEKNGLYLTAIAGPMLINKHFAIIGRGNVGYQFVTDRGFVFTPALGAKFNSLTGIHLDLMMDIGFAYRKSKKQSSE